MQASERMSSVSVRWARPSRDTCGPTGGGAAPPSPEILILQEEVLCADPTPDSWV